MIRKVRRVKRMFKILKAKTFIVFCIFLLVLCFISSCKNHNYLPSKDNAFLVALRFSEGLKLNEEFDRNTFEYNLNIKSEQQEQSKLNGFFVICIPDNPDSKCEISVSGKVKVNELNNTEIPFNKKLPIPFVPIKMKLKTSSIPRITSISGSKKGGMDSKDSDVLVSPLDIHLFNLDPNDLNLPEFPIDPNDPNLPKIPNIPGIPEYVLIELTNFDMKVTVTSPNKSEKVYIVHGKVEK